MDDFADFMKHDDRTESPEHPRVELVINNSLDVMKAKQSLAHHSEAVKKMVEMAKALEVTNHKSLKRATEMELQAKKLAKAIKDGAADIWKEADEFVKSMRNFIRPWTADLDGIIAILKKKSTDFQWRLELDRRKQEEAARKATEELQAKIDAEAAQAGVEAPKLPEPIMPQKKTVVRTGEGTSYLRTEWKGIIVNPEDVPREYCSPDQKKINDAVRMGVREIKGVDIKEVPISVSRT